MILAATTVCSVDLVSQSAILGYHQSALVCILVCLIKFQGRDEKGPPNRSCAAVPGNGGSARKGACHTPLFQLASAGSGARMTLEEYLIACLLFALLIAIGIWGLILLPHPSLSFYYCMSTCW